MKKRGRPAEKPENPIQNVVSVRLSDEDIKMLDLCCEELDASRGKIIRMGIEKVHAGIKK